MAKRDIRIIGDPVLRTPCDPIKEITPGVRQLVQDLLDTVDEPGRAGLAANQIGVSLRAFSWNIEGNMGYILNPVITDMSTDEFQNDDEGCLSVPDLWFPCKRAVYARAEGTDLDGKPVVVEGDGIWGQLVQHEVDHLDGYLYIDRLERSLKKEAFRQLREKQA
ncbi:peptide deformylase [Trueperella bonasi]|uniref:Peptide deformylase n=1 Tax=Trueperella bonasi TaxID=312286 RepID=A0ABT9NJQ5_9ACTO|nr:peptide deformylase [Trueperella bonasi]MDP9807063.1 peptide deformylase [Trueperella bonasi]